MTATFTITADKLAAVTEPRDERSGTLRQGSGDMLPPRWQRVLDDLDRCEEESESIREAPMLGRFVVMSRIGSGGMGAVFEAIDPDLDRTVALKIIAVARPSIGVENQPTPLCCSAALLLLLLCCRPPSVFRPNPSEAAREPANSGGGECRRPSEADIGVRVQVGEPSVGRRYSP